MTEVAKKKINMLARVLRSVLQLLRRNTLIRAIADIAYLLGAWRPISPPQTAAVKRFVETNKPYWSDPAVGGRDIMVGGHLSEAGPNYLFRAGVAAKAVQDALASGDIVVVANGFSYQWRSAKKAFASFGISRWIFLGRKFMLIGPPIFLFSCAMSALCFIRLRTPRQLLDIHLGGIRIGDLIYDEVLRVTKLPTINAVDWNVYKVMARSWFYYYQYHLLFISRDYSCLIATHTAYPEYGLLCRVALQRGVPVIETSDIQMSLYTSIDENNLPTYHQGINARIRADLLSNRKNSEEREALALKGLSQRLDSGVAQIDAQRAYSGRVYDLDELRAALKIPVDQRIGFVFSHIFCDAPHLCSYMLYADYYQWLKSTLECCARSDDMAWIVKSHPSAAAYGEEGLVEAIVDAHGAANIYLSPDDLNTISIKECADVLITVLGTVGLEYACLGIPTILAGVPFYAGFGFTYEPQTVQEYAKTVQKAASIERLSKQQISTALQVFEAWEFNFDWNNTIVTTDVIARVWGYGVSRDLTHAYDLITENLAVHNPKDLKLWHFAGEAVKRQLIQV
ncbi:MAG: hypothetical protein CML33_07690 [Rhodobacteraceae bacterium]|nr:hypothetical protein [Paracoccaceae bacterium]